MTLNPATPADRATQLRYVSTKSRELTHWLRWQADSPAVSPRPGEPASKRKRK